jgi:hypothetical protein
MQRFRFFYRLSEATVAARENSKVDCTLSQSYGCRSASFLKIDDEIRPKSACVPFPPVTTRVANYSCPVCHVISGLVNMTVHPNRRSSSCYKVREVAAKRSIRYVAMEMRIEAICKRCVVSHDDRRPAKRFGQFVIDV